MMISLLESLLEDEKLQKLYDTRNDMKELNTVQTALFE